MSSNKVKEVRTKKAIASKDKSMNVGILEKIMTSARYKKRESVSSLVKRCQQGDKSAFKDLFDRHVHGVYRHLCVLLGPNEDVEDLVQLVFLNVFQSIKKFKGHSAFSTWLFRITINVARQEIRTKSKRRRISKAVKDVNAITGVEELKNPENTIYTTEQIYEVLDKLSPKKRETFILYAYEGYSLIEISELVDSSVSTVGSRLQSARREILTALAR